VAAVGDTVAVNVMLVPTVVLEAEVFSMVDVDVAEVVVEVLLELDDPQPVTNADAKSIPQHTTKENSVRHFISAISF
jgi:hypothetical protein